MNYPGAAKRKIASNLDRHLLDFILTIRMEVGDDLNDDEFTRLLQSRELPTEAGFAFLSYCDWFVTLSVPKQPLANWYPEAGWIMPAKERIARSIAEKYGLSLCEPPDMHSPWYGSPNPRHHLQLSYQHESVMVIHPQYLKIRLFVAASSTQSTKTSHRPLRLGPDLLPDLSKLYQV